MKGIDYDKIMGVNTKKKSSSSKWLKKILGMSDKKCFICGKTEKQVGEIQKAHIKAQSRGGTEYFPLCPNHHRKFDKGKLTNYEIKKLHLTREEYHKLLPKKRKKENTSALFVKPLSLKKLGY